MNYRQYANIRKTSCLKAIIYFYSDAKYQRAPDMIYSFKNIGKAEITGVQAEVQQKFGKYWSGKLGYTYLHAINKSDPSMPRQLLDKPMHKVDIGITYDNPKSGWNGSIWGDYYINMLDSNTLNNGGNYWPNFLTVSFPLTKSLANSMVNSEPNTGTLASAKR